MQDYNAAWNGQAWVWNENDTSNGAVNGVILNTASGLIDVYQYYTSNDTLTTGPSNPWRRGRLP